MEVWQVTGNSEEPHNEAVSMDVALQDRTDFQAPQRWPTSPPTQPPVGAAALEPR